MKLSKLFLLCAALISAQPALSDPPRRTRDPAYEAQKQQPPPARAQENKSEAQRDSAKQPSTKGNKPQV